MDLGLAGKVALVTASTSGLGLATAQVLLEEGAKVFICGRRAEKVDETIETLAATYGSRIDGEPADVSKSVDIARLVGLASRRFGRLDTLVTNAGGPVSGSFDTVSLDDWEKGIQLTLMSNVRLIHAALPHLRQSASPSILTITSVSVKNPIPNLLLSNAIRPAVIGLTKSLSQELGPEGVRVNSILPGYTRTARVDYLLDNRAAANGTTPDEEAAKITATVPLRRMGAPGEFGKVAAFLCSPAASYITGESILVDGGLYSGLM